MKDARAIAFAKDKTRTEGDNFTVLQQLLGNVGRFSSDESGAATVRNPDANRRQSR